MIETSLSSLADLYKQLDHSFDSRAGTDIGFEALVATRPYPMEGAEVDKFRARYALIKSFQQRTLALFNESLQGNGDPALADMILGDLPAHLAHEHHRGLSETQQRTPVFFRTDEPVPGKLSEIQCPGSGWCINEHLRQLYRNNPDIYGKPQHFPQSLAQRFAATLKTHLGRDPIVHHLTDNASRVHGMRYFIQQTREQGVRYFSYDRDIKAGDCNFVRSHDFVSVLHHNFYVDRMQRCNEGTVMFDLPPSALFDGKMIMAWPFWEKTRAAYTDEIRDLFPYTTVIEPSGIQLEDGTKVTTEQFCDLPNSARDYFFKYAGTDISINWGSKSVFKANGGSRVQTRQLMDMILKDWERGRYWVMQKACGARDPVPTVDRNGREFTMDGYAKWSGFYGPEGLMGIMVFHKNFAKVHGSDETVMGIVY
jgi:hypothetical protein